jgi:hypothetical protein
MTGRNEIMDFLTTGFYAIVCGTLAAFAPQGTTRAIRAAIGAAVGVVTALLWPVLHGVLLR